MTEAGKRVLNTRDLVKYQRALRDATMHPDLKLALFCLAARWPDIRPGFTLLSDDMGRSRRQAIRAVGDAINKGWLVETHHGKATGDASRYVLSFPARPRELVTGGH